MNLLALVLQFGLFVVFQRFIFSNLLIYDLAYAKPYLLFVLFLPLSTPRALGLVLSFVFGLCLDLLLMPVGLNAFCCVLVFGLRDVWLQAVTGISRAELRTEGFDLAKSSTNVSFLLSYLLPSVVVFEVSWSLLSSVFSVSLTSILSMLTSILYTGFISFFVALLVYRKAS